MYTLRNHRGITISYLTVLLLLISGLLVALGIDIGHMAFVRRQAQAESDAAALRAASALPLYNVTGQSSQLDETANGLRSGVVH